MLQQTRAQAVIPYYQKFLDRFPTAQDLASAEESAVLHCWSGLGYYQRARNLQRAARKIVERGEFPKTYEEILELPGVGAYTAAAVASIAFGKAHAAVDGNVLRVIARYSGDAADIGAPATRTRFERIANHLLDRRDPARFNQAMMELGATICLPGNPHCLLCPVAADCVARAEARQSELPVKLKRMKAVELGVTLLAIERRGKILLWRRDENARRLGGFWELPATEDLPHAKPGSLLGEFRHSITHHNYRFTVARSTGIPACVGLNKRFEWLPLSGLASLPLSTVARKALAVLGKTIN